MSLDFCHNEDSRYSASWKIKTNLAVVVNFTECNQFILASAKKLFTARMRLEFSKLPSYYIQSEDDPSFHIGKNILFPIYLLLHDIDFDLIKVS